MDNANDMYDIQMRHEAEAVDTSVKRYFDHIESVGMQDTGPGLSLMRALVVPLAEAIDAWLSDSNSGKSTMAAEVYPMLRTMKTRELALLTIRTALHVQTDHKQYGSVCTTLGSLVEEHSRWSALWKDKTKSASLRHAIQRMKDERTESAKRMMARKVLDRLDESYVRWDCPIKAKVGAHLLERLVISTGCFELVVIKERANYSRKLLRMTGEMMGKIEAAHDYASMLSPLTLPMVIEPLPWVSLDSGGLMTRKIGLVKRSITVRELGLSDHQMPNVYEAVNRLQSRPWRINKGVLSVLQQAWEGNMKVAGLVSRELEELPPKPANIGEDAVSRKDWSRRARAVHVRNHRSLCCRLTTATQVACATRFSSYDKLWFPHQLDWRGRIYPVASQLNPQGDDLSRGLLESAVGKPVGEEGGAWLAIHTANMFGHDKLPLAERIKWTIDHRAFIMDAGVDPLGAGLDFWEQADKPWAFLAACMEWAGFELQGAEYITHLPIHVDGSCNGLQHLAAMQRDSEGAALVNLTPSDTPADVYSKMAEQVSAALLVSDHEHAELTRAWLPDGVPRKLVKQPVMTTPYGVTRHGMRAQVMEQMNTMFPTIKGEASQIASCLSDMMWETVGNVVSSAREVMTWFQDCAEVAAEYDVGLSWETPCGYKPTQFYCAMRHAKVEVWVAGKRTQITLQHDTAALDPRKQRAGIAPNVVHSYDASHLLSTVLGCVDNDIEFFTAVHDSYACLAPDMPMLNTLLRSTFVDHYQHDVLAELEEQFNACLPDGATVPKPPKLGDFDIRSVLASDYFFA